MSISKEKITFVGKIFDDKTSALQYLFSKELINKEEFDECKHQVEETGELLEEVVDFSHIRNFPEFSMVDSYFCKNPMIMYRIETDLREGATPEKYKSSVEKAKEDWKRIFGDEVEEDTIIQYS